MKPVAPNLCISRMVSWTSSSGGGFCVALLGRWDGRLEPVRRRDVEPPTVVKSGKSVGQLTICTSRLRLDDCLDMISGGLVASGCKKNAARNLV